jgi:hypothetical protein
MSPLQEWMEKNGWELLPLEPLAGMAAGAICGWLLSPATRGASHPPRFAAMLAVAGVFLGWQAAVSTALIAGLLLLFVAACFPAFAERWLAGAILAAALVQLLFWRIWDGIEIRPSSAPWPVSTALALVLLVVLSRVTGRILYVSRPRAEV